MYVGDLVDGVRSFCKALGWLEDLESTMQSREAQYMKTNPETVIHINLQVYTTKLSTFTHIPLHVCDFCGIKFIQINKCMYIFNLIVSLLY